LEYHLVGAADVDGGDLPVPDSPPGPSQKRFPIDAEIKKITVGMEEKAREVLESNLNQLDALAAALLEHETLTRAEIDGVVKGTQTAN
jgi:ATP-dependent Zn protease